jgi:hypothetical protein
MPERPRGLPAPRRHPMARLPVFAAAEQARSRNIASAMMLERIPVSDRRLRESLSPATVTNQQYEFVQRDALRILRNGLHGLGAPWLCTTCTKNATKLIATSTVNHCTKSKGAGCWG